MTCPGPCGVGPKALLILGQAQQPQSQAAEDPLALAVGTQRWGGETRATSLQQTVPSVSSYPRQMVLGAGESTLQKTK